MRFALVSAALLATGCSLYVDDDAAQPPDPPAPLPRCAPAPVAHTSPVAPDLRQWIADAEPARCSLERRTSSRASNGFPTTLDTFAAPGTVTCDGDGCWVALPAFARAWSQHPAPAAFTWRNEPLGEQWTGMVQAERNQTTGAVRATLIASQFGSGAVRRFERRWDRDGHLIGENESFGGQLWSTTTNTWDGDRLIGSSHLDRINRTGTTDYAWTWSGDRLTSATAVDATTGTRAAAQLAYDGAGHLISIDRTLGDQPWARQTWSYAGDALVRATTELHPSTDQDARLLADADTLVPVAHAAAQNEWDQADGLVATAAGCVPLPHGLQYGYPEADQVYALGWTVGDRPDGIDGDYGFGNVYDVGLDRWFGHDRVEAYTFLSPFEVAAVTGELGFDEHGRMIVEHLATADGTLDSVRSRDFDGARLVGDHRILRRDGDTMTTALGFEHDEAGRVVARSYAIDGGLAGRHAWSYGSAGVRHTIESLAFAPWPEPGRSFTIPDRSLLPSTLGAPVVYDRTIAGTAETWRRDDAVLETRRRDGAGRVTERRLGDSYEHFAYDAAGELVAYDTGYEPTPSSSLSYQRDASGRLLSRSWSYAPNDSDTDVFSYVCR